MKQENREEKIDKVKNKEKMRVKEKQGKYTGHNGGKVDR